MLHFAVACVHCMNFVGMEVIGGANRIQLYFMMCSNTCTPYKFIYLHDPTNNMITIPLECVHEQLNTKGFYLNFLHETTNKCLHLHIAKNIYAPFAFIRNYQ